MLVGLLVCFQNKLSKTSTFIPTFYCLKCCFEEWVDSWAGLRLEQTQGCEVHGGTCCLLILGDVLESEKSPAHGRATEQFVEWINKCIHLLGNWFTSSVWELQGYFISLESMLTSCLVLWPGVFMCSLKKELSLPRNLRGRSSYFQGLLFSPHSGPRLIFTHSFHSGSGEGHGGCSGQSGGLGFRL